VSTTMTEILRGFRPGDRQGFDASALDMLYKTASSEVISYLRPWKMHLRERWMHYC